MGDSGTMNMAMTACGKGEAPAREVHDLRWGWSLLAWEQQEEITNKFWTYPSITFNEKERRRE